MKYIKRVIFSIIILLSIISILLYTKESKAMQDYRTTEFSIGIVNVEILNVRQGPKITYNIIEQIYENEEVRIFAQIGEWYIIQTEKDYIGAVNSKYINPKDTNTEVKTEAVTNIELNSDEQEVLKLINQERNLEGLSDLLIDEELQNVAKIKAEDMVKNNYFSHTSPTNGTPFEMLKAYKISYRVAGENIAGNSSNSGAVNAWMGSSGHKENILNNAYNYTAIAVVNSEKYGKIYVQLFIGK